MTKKTYTFTACYQVLNVDPKTFRRWLEKAEMVPHVSKSDSRVKYLTEEQVHELAQAHDRELHTTKSDNPVTYGAYKLLADRLSDVEQELQDTRELVGNFERRLSDLEKQGLPARRPKTKVSPLPPELQSLYTFTNMHGVPQNEVRQRIKTGSIHPLQGNWTNDKGRVEEALDSTGQREFWSQFHNRPDFRTCDICPHDR